MGYGLQIPAHQLGGPKRVWDFWGYGLSNAWVMRVSTVPCLTALSLRNAQVHLLYIYCVCTRSLSACWSVSVLDIPAGYRIQI
jgi:hypothetical protein